MFSSGIYWGRCNISRSGVIFCGCGTKYETDNNNIYFLLFRFQIPPDSSIRSI